MKRIGLTIGIVLLVAAQAGLAMAYGEAVFNNPIYATRAGASYYYVTDQTVNVWGNDGGGNPVAVSTRDNDNATVIQGPDQNWGGTGNIMPGLIDYDNFLGAPDYVAAGFGGAASGGSLVVAFDQDFVNGDGIDFMLHGFGFCFNEAFSTERGTIRIYVAGADYNPAITAADSDGPGPLGQITIIGDESKWVLLSEWQGWGDWDDDPDTADTWDGNPDMNYSSSPGTYGEFLWGDLEGSGLESARYIKFELGDGGHFINSYTGDEDNNGRALFVDAVEARGYEAPANQAPELASIGDRQVNGGVLLTFTLQATDPEEDVLTFSYSDDPEMAGATLDPNTGVFAWTPPDGVDGNYTVTFTVTDDGSPMASDQETIEITVGNVNHPPVFEDNAPALTYAALEGQTISFEVSATDPDGDGVSFDVTGLPDGADFSDGVFNWATDFEDAGSYTLIFTATDDGSPSETATKTVTLTVGNVNHPPVFEDNAPALTYATLEGRTISFEVSATDPDGDGVSFDVTGLPDGADFSDGVFTWATDFEDAGSYTPIFTATDDGSPSETATKTVTLTVGNVNCAPVFDSGAPAATYTVNEGETITFEVSATDPDGDGVSFDIAGLPDGAGFSNGIFAWATDVDDAGSYALTFKATDDGSPSETATKTVTLTVNVVNYAPAFDEGAPAATYTTNEGETIMFSVSATDPEGDAISFCITGLPGGADFLNGVFTWATESGDAGGYTLVFTATDNGSPSKSATQCVTLSVVAGVSQHAGSDQVVTEQTSVILGIPETGDGQSDAYQWVQTSGPEVTISDATSAAPTFIAPKVEADSVVLTFQSTLNSDLTDDVSITVQDNAIQLTEAEEQQLESADLVFDNRIGADINALDNCHMGITGEEGELTFYDINDPADMETDESAPDNLIYGLFEFELVLSPGTQTAVWSILLPEPAPEEYRWYKYNSVTGEWIDFSRDLISDGMGDGAEFNADRNRLTLYVTDGGEYDDDGVVNQKVIDPSGLGTKSATGDGDGESGGGGGCFIGTLVDNK